MENSQKKWVIKDAMGRISGPFTTEKILHKIKRSELTGEEYISLYPSGEWLLISKDPVFYDRLLEVLSQQYKNENVTEKTQEDVLTIRVPEDQQNPQDQKRKPITSKEELFAELDLQDEPDEFARVEPTRDKQRRKRKKKEDPGVLELVNMKGRVFREALKKSRFILVGAVAVLVLVFLFVGEEAPREGRIHLIAPKIQTKVESVESAKKFVSQGLSEFLGDYYEGYLLAQNQFVLALEANPKQSDVFALLCMTYLELWPYSFQDSTDLRAISQVVQQSSAVDPGGQNSATCRTVDLIVKGRYQEAKNLTESVLETQVSQSRPPIMFYYLKGYLLEGSNELTPAIGYFRSAQQLWPQWVKPFFHEAVTLIRAEKYNDAANNLYRIVKASPKHVRAQVELGLIEYKFLNRVDSGQKLLEQAVGSGRKLSGDMGSRAYLGLAEIALTRGDSSKALSYAKKAYVLNSRNTIAQNMVVQLGGADGLKKVKVAGEQLVFEGDQFFREGDFNSAQAHYRAAFEEDNKNAVAAMKAAKANWKLSFTTEAFEWLNRAIKADSKLIEAYVLLADYQTQRFNFLAATKVLAQAQAVAPKSAEVFRGFALIELRRGNPEGAITFGKKSIDLYETDVDSHILMSEAYMDKGDHRLAYNYAAKAIEIDVNNREAQAIYARALGGIQGSEAAIDYLNKLVSSYPLVGEYRLALAKVLAQDERYEQAETVFRQILKLEDKPKEALLGLAQIQKSQGQAKEALESLLRAAVIDPADAEPLFEAGMIYLDANQPKLALNQFERVDRINKYYPRIRYEMGRAYLKMNDPKKALEETRLEKSMNPNLADAYLLAAEAYMTLKQYSLCASEYQQAIKLRPQSATIFVKLAQCYRRSGNLDAAMAMLTQAATQESGLADIYKEQGAIYETRGDVDHAIESYNQYFVLDPNAPDRYQIEQRIMSLQSGNPVPE